MYFFYKSTNNPPPGGEIFSTYAVRGAGAHPKASRITQNAVEKNIFGKLSTGGGLLFLCIWILCYYNIQSFLVHDLKQAPAFAKIRFSARIRCYSY